MRRVVSAFGLGVLLLAAASSAEAYSFTCLSQDSLPHCATGQTQLSVQLSSYTGPDQVLFTFFNIGPNASSITAVYFDDGGLLGGVAAILNGPGVSFSQGATPPNLPAGRELPRQFQADFAADSNAPTAPNGVGPGETLGIAFDLEPGKTLENVHLAVLSSQLRIGVHAQGFNPNGSESFIVSSPWTLVLLGGGLLAISLGQRFRRAEPKYSVS